MTLLHLVVIAVVQGITEFLPISSSAHLIMIAPLTGWPDQGQDIDVAAHVGTLLAVLLYFRADVAAMVGGGLRLLGGRFDDGARLALNLVVATIPVVIAGYLLKRHVGDGLRSVELIAWTTIIFALVLWIADRIGMTFRRVEHLRLPDAVILGLAQAIALIPGVSRAGITMTAGRFLGLERADAARFASLMGIPTIAAAGTLAGLDLAAADSLSLTLDALIVAGLSFVTALAALAVMMRWLKRSGFGPFVFYRLVMGGFLLAWVHGAFAA